MIKILWVHICGGNTQQDVINKYEWKAAAGTRILCDQSVPLKLEGKVFKNVH